MDIYKPQNSWIYKDYHIGNAYMITEKIKIKKEKAQKICSKCGKEYTNRGKLCAKCFEYDKG